jgi:hypothetical protein
LFKLPNKIIFIIDPSPLQKNYHCPPEKILRTHDYLMKKGFVSDDWDTGCPNIIRGSLTYGTLKIVKKKSFFFISE